MGTNLNPNDIPDEDVRRFFELKMASQLPERSEPPNVLSTTAAPDQIPLGLPRNALNILHERARFFELPNADFFRWAQNRALAIRERNERKLNLVCKPIYLDVELNIMCNYKCTFCPCIPLHSKDKLTTEEIDILSPLFDFAEVVETSKAGEPFLTPELFIYFMKTLRKRNPFAIVHTVTNGSPMRADLLDCLISQKLDHMYISLCSHEPKLYHEYSGGDLAIVAKNMLKLVEEKQKRNSAEPYIHFNCQMSKYADPFRILDIAARFGVVEVNFIKTQMTEANLRFKGKPIQDFMSVDEIQTHLYKVAEYASEKRIAVNFSGWSGAYTAKAETVPSRHNCNYYYPHLTKYFKRDLTCPTDAPWFRFCTAMRKVQPCCWSGAYADWTKKSFDEIWNGEYLVNLRRQLRDGVYPSVCHCKY